LPAQFRGALVQEMSVGREAVLGQHDGRSAETVCLDDVRTGLEVSAMDIQNDVGAGSDQVFIASFESGSAKIRRRQVALLQHGAHRAIQHENALREQLSQSLGRFVQVTHLLEGCAPCRVP